MLQPGTKSLEADESLHDFSTFDSEKAATDHLSHMNTLMTILL